MSKIKDLVIDTFNKTIEEEYPNNDYFNEDKKGLSYKSKRSECFKKDLPPLMSQRGSESELRKFYICPVHNVKIRTGNVCPLCKNNIPDAKTEKDTRCIYKTGDIVKRRIEAGLDYNDPWGFSPKVV